MRDELINKAREFFAGHEYDEFYRAVAYSGYRHAIDKQHEVLADFALKCRPGICKGGQDCPAYGGSLGIRPHIHTDDGVFIKDGGSRLWR